MANNSGHNGVVPGSVKSEPVETQFMLGDNAVSHYVCWWKDCLRIFMTSEDLVGHVQGHAGKWPYVCHWQECDANYGNMRSLEAHIIFRHTNNTQALPSAFPAAFPRAYPCPECDGIFPNQIALTKHAQLHKLVKVEVQHHDPVDMYSRRMPVVNDNTREGTRYTTNWLDHSLEGGEGYSDSEDEDATRTKATVVKEVTSNTSKKSRRNGQYAEVASMNGAGANAHHKKSKKSHEVVDKDHQPSTKSASSAITSTGTSKKVRREKDQAEHQQVVRHTAVHKCITCWSEFPSEQYLKLHIRGMHKKSDKLYPCTYEHCTMGFNQSSKLIPHLGLHDAKLIDEFGKRIGAEQSSTNVSKTNTIRKPAREGRTKRSKTSTDSTAIARKSKKAKALPREYDGYDSDPPELCMCEIKGCCKTFKTEKGLQIHYGMVHGGMRTITTQGHTRKSVRTTKPAKSTPQCIEAYEPPGSEDRYPSDIQTNIPSRRDRKIALEKQAQIGREDERGQFSKHLVTAPRVGKQPQDSSKKDGGREQREVSTYVNKIPEHICEECGEAFYKDDILRMHMRMHLKDTKLYECLYKADGCTHSYDTSKELFRHLATHCPEQIIDISSDSDSSPRLIARTTQTPGSKKSRNSQRAIARRKATSSSANDIASAGQRSYRGRNR
ncbi:hypothetical protein SARC_00410 [Sphaeroforma arctica JP610]|uniref:C2H2-type domain-containing protein n=1 Tax=Sphaeroforma arctica JP610 TaxID=667725 RepID=A0A0L0GEN2_9EUKA|nr:hypothetical protein SARC_00410 [Sphaeroforma arctica JP610]KNC87475.1 hypothetical protein SARC_00410 [Sphaeroforma arctica JP610]|eukprot:XP_014161377.1 hypothetical protein SARC_00410 [Sphaeroforma arctica JP610]